MARNPHNNISHVLSQILTKDDTDLVLEVMASLEENLYQTDIAPLADTLAKKLPQRISDAIQLAIQEPLAAGDIHSIKDFFSELRETIRKLIPVRLKIAFEPTAEGVEEIAHWVVNEVGKDAIADIEVNKVILGGVQIVFQGRIWEKTLNQMIADALDQNRGAIIKDLVS